MLLVVLKSEARRKQCLMVESAPPSWRVEVRVQERTEEVRVDALFMTTSRKRGFFVYIFEIFVLRNVGFLFVGIMGQGG